LLDGMAVELGEFAGNTNQACAWPIDRVRFFVPALLLNQQDEFGFVIEELVQVI